MLLSIIIPCYNCEGNIGILLNIIKKQLSNQIQLVLINDGSHDGTNDIIVSFIKENPSINIDYIDSDNKGAAKAREIGLEYAKGNYIFFCDSDDEISEKFVSVFLELSQKKPDMIYFSSNILYSKHHKVAKVSFSENHLEKDSNNVLNYLLKRNQWSAAVWTYIFRKDLIKKTKACFTQRKVHEDHLFTLRLLSGSNLISICNTELYQQKMTPGSLTKSPKKLSYFIERYIAYKEARNEMVGKFNEENIMLYDRWSISSLVNILKENKKMIIIGILNLRLYPSLWKEKVIIINYIKSKFLN